MPDHQFKAFGYDQIYKICVQFGLPLYPADYLESAILSTWRFKCFGKISDIKRYELEFKSRIHKHLIITAEEGLINVIAPKPNPDTVYLNDVLKSDWFDQCPGKLKIAVGESAKYGTRYVACLEDWEHVLIAGTSGGGKTLFMHTIIHSLIRKNSPEEVKFILVDFKGNEFSHYENIRYLELPVIYRTDVAVKALNWLIDEMNRRYDLMKEKGGYRDIYDYNEEQNEKLHHIVVMIDEFAKITLKEKGAEDLLIELSQMARASGIYLILTVHKPTKNSINSTIKEMITTRISFKVNDYQGSKAILDKAGAEDLIGDGDMILIENSEEERIKSCFITREEIKELGKKYRNDNMFTNQDIEEIIEEEPDEDYIIFYKAARHCLEEDKCNLKTIYDAVRVGERKQEEILKRMIKEGIVSKEKSYYGRNDILMSLDEFLEKYEEV